MTITIPISIVATNGSILDDGVFSFNSTLPHDHRLAAPNHPKTASRNRTSSATDSSQPVSTFESLSINAQLPNNQRSRDTSPSIRARRFSGDIVLPPSSPSEVVEPSLFSPGSVRARTISSLQENKNPSPTANRPNAPGIIDPVPTPSPPKRLDIRLSAGKTVNTSDFVHSHLDASHHDQQANQSSHDTARNKLLQSVYINNTNAGSTSSLSEPLTNGTNPHTLTTESPSNCLLS